MNSYHTHFVSLRRFDSSGFSYYQVWIVCYEGDRLEFDADPIWRKIANPIEGIVDAQVSQRFSTEDLEEGEVEFNHHSLWQYIGSWGWSIGEGYKADETLLTNVPSLKDYSLPKGMPALAWFDVKAHCEANEGLSARLWQKCAEEKAHG